MLLNVWGYLNLMSGKTRLFPEHHPASISQMSYDLSQAYQVHNMESNTADNTPV